jgi:CheY-like chemotaxis protein
MTGEFLNVLLVEDEESNINAWTDAVDTHNVDFEHKGFTIKWENAKSLITAKERLATNQYDAVIVDLRLQRDIGSSGHNDDGNALVKELIATKPVGIVVYSGQPAEAEYYACSQVTVIDRAAGLPPVFDWLGTHKNMFFALGRAKLVLDEQTAQLFYKAIWPRWKYWAEEGDAKAIGKMLARHISSHVHDSLLNESNGTTHPEESYFVPPIKDRLDTGDLIKLEDETVWVVVTPRCDLAHENKTDTVLIAQCKDISIEWSGLITGEASKTKDEKIKKLKKHGDSFKQHFLPPMKDNAGKALGPWMVQFHHLQSHLATKAKANFTQKRFSTISPHFVPSLVERFGAYFSRIGTPDIEE